MIWWNQNNTLPSFNNSKQQNMKKLLMVVITSITMVSCSKSDLVTPTGTTTKISTTSVQCSSTAVSTGKRCLNMTKSSNGKCYLHGGN